MQALGWDACDVIVVTGDAYIDHPSFGMALIGRLLESFGYRVGIIAQPDWTSVDDFMRLGPPQLFFGVTSGNMDSMVNRYTSDRKRRSDDAYTEGGMADRRPDRAVTVYAQRCREAVAKMNASRSIPIVIGSIEASLRRIAHYDYWSDKVRKSVLLDSKADMLIFGNAERALLAIAERLATGESIEQITNIRGTAFCKPAGWLPNQDWQVVDGTRWQDPPTLLPHANPYVTASINENNATCKSSTTNDGITQPIQIIPKQKQDLTSSTLIPAVKKSSLPLKPSQINAAKRYEIFPRPRAEESTITQEVFRLPSYEQVSTDPIAYAHASRQLHLESNPGNARALIQFHADAGREVWINAPPMPLSTTEMDWVYGLPYARAPHPSYGPQHDPAHKIPAWEMIRFSVNIMRGCFGGCTFCSITEHEGRIIQSRSESSILNEIEEIRDKTPGFTGVISDLGGPTANMWRLNCKDSAIEKSCRRLSCVYPNICKNLDTDHRPLISLYRKARDIRGVKKVLIGSGVRYDLAVRSPDYIRALAQFHVGGYLKIAPEHTEEGVLTKMMKPGIGAYERFRQLFERYSREVGKEQYLIPYFIAGHPGSTDRDMMRLAQWLQKNKFRPDQVQAFLPTPMAMATTMYHSKVNPLKPLNTLMEKVDTIRGEKARRVQKAYLRYHDPANWAILRESLRELKRTDLIGDHPGALVPNESANETRSPRSQMAAAPRGFSGMKHRPASASNKLRR